MKNIIGYKLFRTEKEFKKWQEENSVRIHSIQPLPSTGDLTQVHKDSMDITLHISVFVTYSEI